MWRSCIEGSCKNHSDLFRVRFESNRSSLLLFATGRERNASSCVTLSFNSTSFSFCSGPFLATNFLIELLLVLADESAQVNTFLRLWLPQQLRHGTVLRDARAAAFKHNARKPIDHDAASQVWVRMLCTEAGVLSEEFLQLAVLEVATSECGRRTGSWKIKRLALFELKLWHFTGICSPSCFLLGVFINFALLDELN